MMIMFLRMRIPNIPIENKIEANKMYPFKELVNKSFMQLRLKLVFG